MLTILSTSSDDNVSISSTTTDPDTDNNSFEQWEADGNMDSTQRANVIWKKMLDEYEMPAIDPAVDEALLAFIQQRKESFPDANY